MTASDNYVTLGDSSKSVEVYNKQAIDIMFMSVSSGEAPEVDLSNYVTNADLETKIKSIKQEVKDEYEDELDKIKDDINGLAQSTEIVDVLRSIDITQLGNVSDIVNLKQEITELKKTVENLLSTIKTMNDNDRILFKLMDLYTEISSITNSLSNIGNRVSELETQKGTIDATNTMLVTLNSAVQQCERTVETYENRVGTLEQGARTTTTNITTLGTRIAALENTNNNTVLPFVTAAPTTYATKTELEDYTKQTAFETLEGRVSDLEEAIVELQPAAEGENEG